MVDFKIHIFLSAALSANIIEAAPFVPTTSTPTSADTIKACGDARLSLQNTLELASNQIVPFFEPEALKVQTNFPVDAVLVEAQKFIVRARKNAIDVKESLMNGRAPSSENINLVSTSISSAKAKTLSLTPAQDDFGKKLLAIQQTLQEAVTLAEIFNRRCSAIVLSSGSAPATVGGQTSGAPTSGMNPAQGVTGGVAPQAPTSPKAPAVQPVAGAGTVVAPAAVPVAPRL